MSAADDSVRVEFERRLTESLESRRAAAEQRVAEEAARVGAEQEQAEAQARAAAEERERSQELARALFGILPDVATAAMERGVKQTPFLVQAPKPQPQSRWDRLLGRPVEYGSQLLVSGGAWLIEASSEVSGVKKGATTGTKTDTGFLQDPDKTIYTWTVTGIEEDGKLVTLQQRDMRSPAVLGTPMRLINNAVRAVSPEDYTTQDRYDALADAVTNFCIKHELEEPLLALGQQAQS